MPTQQIKGSKRYRQAVEMVDLTKDYTLADASALLIHYLKQSSTRP